jgi:hypothetical protein
MDKATRLIPSAKEVHARIRAELAEEARSAAAVTTIAPVDFSQRTRNLLRPARLDDMTGQVRLRGLLRRLIDAAQAAGRAARTPPACRAVRRRQEHGGAHRRQ